MCEAKPGPRCSADTLKTLNNSTERVSLAYRSLTDLENRNVNGELNSQIAAVRETINETEEQIVIDRAIYNATPEGMKELERLSNKNKKSTLSDENFELIELQVSKEHREWQQNALKHINGLKNESATPARLELEGSIMLQQIIYSKESVADVLRNEKEKFQTLVEETANSQDTPEQEASLKELKNRIFYYETYITYSNIRGNDVNDFIKKQRKLADSQ